MNRLTNPIIIHTILSLECCEERLQGFNLTAYPMDGTLTPYTYKEPGLGKPQDVYHVLPDDSYLKVPIQAVRVEAADGILTLCEVVIYGGKTEFPSLKEIF